MVKITILKKPAAKTLMTTAQMMFEDIWEQFKDWPTQGECRGSGAQYVRPPIPDELKEKSLNDKLQILKNGAPEDFEASDIAKFLVATCINDEMSTRYSRLSTARKYASEQARKA